MPQSAEAATRKSKPALRPALRRRPLTFIVERILGSLLLISIPVVPPPRVATSLGRSRYKEDRRDIVQRRPRPCSTTTRAMSSFAGDSVASSRKSSRIAGPGTTSCASLTGERRTPWPVSSHRQGQQQQQEEEQQQEEQPAEEEEEEEQPRL